MQYTQSTHACGIENGWLPNDMLAYMARGDNAWVQGNGFAWVGHKYLNRGCCITRLFQFKVSQSKLKDTYKLIRQTYHCHSSSYVGTMFMCSFFCQVVKVFVLVIITRKEQEIKRLLLGG